jgi:two-component system response regulator NreC
VNKVTLRVLVSDGNLLFRQGIRALLSTSQDLRVVDEATDGPETILKAETHQPDVLLLDMDIIGLRSFEVARAVRRVSGRSRILFLTAGDQSERIQAAIASCAEGYLLKSASVDVFLKTLRRSAPPRDLTRQGFDRLLEDLHALSSKVNDRHPDPNVLTQREREVLAMIVQGCTAKEIAEHFRLSPKTVEAHKFNLMRKLDVHTRGELIDEAVKQRLVPSLAAPRLIR